MKHDKVTFALVTMFALATSFVQPALGHPTDVYVPPRAALPRAVPLPERVIYYYQTQYYNGQYQSLSPIWKHVDPRTHQPYVTDVMIAAFHLGYNGRSPYIHLNDNPPGDPMFNVMWPEVAKLQRLGISDRMMLGGAAQGSYAVLFAHWGTFFPILKQTLRQYHLNGIDLDVEENVSLGNIETLIEQLRAEFGPAFIITLSPVCSALWGGANLSGFSYIDLYRSTAGADIAWFNGQFYSGFGSLSSKADYDHVLAAGIFTADKVVAGTISNPQDGGGFVPIPTVVNTVHALVAEHPNFGGLAAWEYFNAEPDGQKNPAAWARIMTHAMH